MIKTEPRPPEAVYKEKKIYFIGKALGIWGVLFFSFYTKITLKGLFFYQLFSPVLSGPSYCTLWKHLLQLGALSQSPQCSVWLYPSDHEHIEKQALGNYLF